MRILRIFIDPVIEGKRLSERYKVNIKELHASVIHEWSKISGGDYYFLPEIITVPSIPPKEDMFSYTEEGYAKVLRGESEPHRPDIMDYASFINTFSLIKRKNNHEFDEVHVYGAPWMGCYESRMIGRNAIWCNAPALPANCDNFIIMGFNYERGISEAIEAFGHRTESILKYTNPSFFEDFTEVVGTIHIPHNAKLDYDWGNKTMVDCFADKYPDAYISSNIPKVSLFKSLMNFIRALLGLSALKNFYRNTFNPMQRNCEYWKCNSLDYFRYWFAHIPKELMKQVVDPKLIGE